MDMTRTQSTQSTVNVNFETEVPNLYRRAALNSLAILGSDSLMMIGTLSLANWVLWWINDIPFSIRNGFLIVPAWTLISAVARLLPGWGMGVVDELRKIQGALFILYTMVLLALFVVKNDQPESRIVFLLSYFLNIGLIPFSRAVTRGIIIRMYGTWGVPVSIYGNRSTVRELTEVLQTEKGLGYIPSGIFTDEMPLGNVINGVPVVGRLCNTTSRNPFAIVSLEGISRRRLFDIMAGPLETYRRVIMISDLIETSSLWVIPRDFHGRLGLEIKKNLLNPITRFIKRFIDLSLTLAAMPLWGPLIAVLYMLVWFDDRKNPLFFQPRIGEGGKMFRTVKFRTMLPNAEQVLQKALKKDPVLKAEWETHFKLKKDPRITRMGKFLRRTSLDEIPQMLNILTGSMTLVGPRPLPVYHFQSLSKQVRFLRNKVKPGVTGLWQVSGRSEAGTSGMEKWDPYYIRNWSIWLDIVILVRTFKVVFTTHGAY